jgi:branched-chain amino acid transport system ATP-binding protein
VLRVDNLESAYGLAPILNGLSVDVPDGALVALLGRNGMGKTSLCRCIMGMRPPRITGGRIELKGEPLTRLMPHQIARLGIGYVPQGRRIFPSLDVVENLVMSARLHKNGPGWDLERVWEMFPRLAERKHHGAGQLSGGEQQMLAIARALMTNPELLVMDEPSEGLAPVVVEGLGDRLQALKGERLSVLLVEQNFTLAMKLADVAYVMEDGRTVFKGTPQELEGNTAVKERHLGVGV